MLISNRVKHTFRCSRHQNAADLYCETCKIPICITCIGQEHNRHTFSSIENAEETLADLVRQLGDRAGRASLSSRRKVEQIDEQLSAIDEDGSTDYAISYLQKYFLLHSENTA